MRSAVGKMIFRIIVIVYFVVFYVLSWIGVYFWITIDSEVKQIVALSLGLFLIFSPIVAWFLRKDLKKNK